MSGLYRRMPKFAFTPEGLVVDASSASYDTEFLCCSCAQPLVFVRSSNRSEAHFRHRETNDNCENSALTQDMKTVDSPAAKRPMTEWHTAWQKLGEAVCPGRCEVYGIGDDIRRPRDLGAKDANAMVEIQHSPMSSEEYDGRNAGVNCATWIFDATSESIEKYKFGEIWFCEDRYRKRYKTDNKCRVLFHCADGNLYQSECDDAVDIEVDQERRYVRILKAMDADARDAVNAFFGDVWPLKDWNGAPDFQPASPIQSPIRVLSEAGRREVDAHHRHYMYRFPTAPRTVVSAPPGAGKTTAIIEMMRRWQKRALVITFNKATQETMQQRIREAGLTTMADARTIDSLCCEASSPSLMKWTDWELCNEFWPKSALTKFGKYGGGRRASNIIDFRFRHPRASVSICKQHRRLAVKGSDWDAGFATYPMQRIVQGCKTHAACRYVCDQRRSLRPKLDAYDVILVDEMQDLISAQEQRLLFQTCKPVVLVGDLMQAINNYRDDPPCTECTLEREDAPSLPCAIEWYGTWRLDGFTARFIEERFGRRMYSYRACDETAEVYWKDELVYEKTLVMCRYNKHVIETAIHCPSMRIVSGESLADRLRNASKDTSMLTPMAKYAQELDANGNLNEVCEMLRDRSIKLADVKDTAAVTTVHQAKGFEYDHCAVHSDLLSPENEDERNISFVAFTRHKKSLVVMDDRHI